MQEKIAKLWYGELEPINTSGRDNHKIRRLNAVYEDRYNEVFDKLYNEQKKQFIRSRKNNHLTITAKWYII